MNDYKLEQSNNSICLKIISYNQNGCGLIFIQGVALVFFLLPIIVTFFLTKGVSLGGIVSWLFTWILSGYFMRLYLWGKFGKEVFILKNNELRTYYDYKFFKDNHRYFQFNNLEIVFFVGAESFLANMKAGKENDNRTSKIGFQLDKEVITSHKELPISEIINISKHIKQFSG